MRCFGKRLFRINQTKYLILTFLFKLKAKILSELGFWVIENLLIKLYKPKALELCSALGLIKYQAFFFK